MIKPTETFMSKIQATLELALYNMEPAEKMTSRIEAITGLDRAACSNIVEGFLDQRIGRWAKTVPAYQALMVGRQPEQLED